VANLFAKGRGKFQGAKSRRVQRGCV
jgi:hypothetical protein